MTREPTREAPAVPGHVTAERVMPMDAYLQADRLVLHIDLLDADPRTASIALDGDALRVTAAHTSGNRTDAWYVHELSLEESIEPRRVRARVHEGVVTITLDLRDPLVAPAGPPHWDAPVRQRSATG